MTRICRDTKRHRMINVREAENCLEDDLEDLKTGENRPKLELSD